ncbi:MAG: glycyl-radical enzyme activating protein [Acutalibacteraceae bacterium]|nr:glycyl-radical enzyme activating protein [Acutalibacteraceae bacterium]
MTYGIISDIKRFAVHDGDGIRTTLFLKGCSLKCVWCHNPEGIAFNPQLAVYSNKCTGCMECAKVCPNNAHIFKDGVHEFKSDLCKECSECEKNCFSKAITLYGKRVTVDEILPLLLEDRAFYETSSGGVTLSGGECLCQADFCAELLKRLKEEGIHTAVDTCGYVQRESIDKVLPYTDVFLYDIKAIDSNVHIKCTGQPNELILENLKYIDSMNKAIEIRIPYVPDYNSGEIEKIGKFIAELKNVTKVRVLAYHNYSGSKYEALSMENTLPENLPTTEEIEKAVNYLKALGINAVS